MDGARQRFRFAERRYNSRAEQSVAAGQRFADRRWSDSQEIPGESLDTEDGSRETSARNHPAAIGFRGTLWRVPQLWVSLPQIDVVNRPTRTLSEPDGICSSGVGQHPAPALAPPLGRITPIPPNWNAWRPRSLLLVHHD